MLRIKAERLKRGWPQIVPAYRAKLAVSDYSRIESGRNQPYPGQLKRLSKAFGLDPDALMEDVGDSPAIEKLTQRPQPAA